MKTPPISSEQAQSELSTITTKTTAGIFGSSGACVVGLSVAGDDVTGTGHSTANSSG